MTREELLSVHEELTEKALELVKIKNNDYAGKSGTDPFANFRRCEALGICTTEAGFLVRLTDKMSRLSTFTESGSLLVKDESAEDTILDIINYSILFAAYVRSKRPLNTSKEIGGKYGNRTNK